MKYIVLSSNILISSWTEMDMKVAVPTLILTSAILLIDKTSLLQILQ